MSHEKILLVDDEEDFTSILSKRLKNRGIEVMTASSGKVALELAREHSFDAIVLDMQMPEMDGIETLNRLMQIDPEHRVIILTGYGTVGKGIEAMKSGAMDFLEKPADINELMDKISVAAQKRLVVVQERSAEKIDDILKKKGW